MEIAHAQRDHMTRDFYNKIDTLRQRDSGLQADDTTFTERVLDASVNYVPAFHLLEKFGEILTDDPDHPLRRHPAQHLQHLRRVSGVSGVRGFAVVQNNSQN